MDGHLGWTGWAFGGWVVDGVLTTGGDRCHARVGTGLGACARDRSARQMQSRSVIQLALIGLLEVCFAVVSTYSGAQDKCSGY